MAIAQGRYGKITMQCTGVRKTISEIGNWSLSGVSRDMIEHTAFGDSAKKFAPGIMDGGTVTFGGFYDNRSTGQIRIRDCFTSGKAIGSSGTAAASCGCSTRFNKLRLWVSTSTSFEFKGFYGTTAAGSGCRFYVQGFDVGQDKNGLATFTATLRVSHNALKFSTAT